MQWKLWLGNVMTLEQQFPGLENIPSSDEDVHDYDVVKYIIRLYSTNHVYIHRFSRLWFCVCV